MYALTGCATSVAINLRRLKMKTTKLRLVSFGSAKALTRDTLPGPFLEMNVIQSRTAEG
jgi:hypothetical protein